MLDKIKNLLIFFLKPNKVWCSALYSLPQFSFEKSLGTSIEDNSPSSTSTEGFILKKIQSN